MNMVLYYPLSKFLISMVLGDLLDSTSISGKVLNNKNNLTKGRVLTNPYQSSDNKVEANVLVTSKRITPQRLTVKFIDDF